MPQLFLMATWRFDFLICKATYQGDFDGAIKAYKTATRINRKMAPAHFMLGLALQKKRRLAEAVASFRKAIQFDDKGISPFHNGLAWTLATGPDGVRHGQDAVKHATRACELTEWKAPEFIDTLAAAYAEAGDCDKAVEYQERTLTFPGFSKLYGKDAHERL